MTAVWYVGPADARSISAAQWAAAGVTGVAATSWDSTNGWSIPKANLTSAQLTVLAADGEFNLNAQDGVNTGRTPAGGNPGVTVPATKYDITTEVAARVAATARANAIARERSDFRAKGVMSPFTFTVSGSQDATTTKSYTFDTTGMSANTNRLCTDAELAAFPVDFGLPDAVHQIQCATAGQPGFKWVSCGPTKTATTTATSGGNNLMVAPYRTYTNSPKISFECYVPLSANQGYKVYVDGLPCNSLFVTPGSFVDFVTITLDGNWHEVTIKTSGFLYAVLVVPTYDVIKPDTTRGLTMHSTGDSYSAATVWADNGTGTGCMEEGFAGFMEDLLGVDDHYIDAIGGTGFIQRAANTYQSPSNNYIDRTVPMINRMTKCDIFIVPNGCANDVANNQNQAAIVAAIKIYILAVRARFPLAKIIYGLGLIPPYTLWTGKAPTYLAIAAALQADPQVASAGVYYVDTTGWLTGLGYNGNPASLGNFTINSGNNQLVYSASVFAAGNVGQTVTGTGIPANTKITAVAGDGKSATMSNNATASSTTTTVTFSTKNGQGNTDWATGADQVHATRLGYYTLKRRMAHKVRRIIADDGTLVNTFI